MQRDDAVFFLNLKIHDKDDDGSLGFYSRKRQVNSNASGRNNLEHVKVTSITDLNDIIDKQATGFRDVRGREKILEQVD